MSLNTVSQHFGIFFTLLIFISPSHLTATTGTTQRFFVLDFVLHLEPGYNVAFNFEVLTSCTLYHYMYDDWRGEQSDTAWYTNAHEWWLTNPKEPTTSPPSPSKEDTMPTTLATAQRSLATRALLVVYDFIALLLRW